MVEAGLGTSWLPGPGPLWQHPEWLVPAGAILGLAALALALGRRVARRRAQVLLGPRAPGRGRPGDLLLIAALAAILVALAGPRLGTREVRAPSTGVDVVVLLDVSRSMEATDTPPSRLDRARRVAAEALAALRPGDRAALAVYASHGVTLTPLTPDAAALVEMLPAVDTDLLRDRGSDLDAGLAAALRAFGDEAGDLAPTRPRSILLLSDGETPGTDAPDAGGVARAGARIVAVGLGTEQGVVLRDGDGVLRDASGRRVVSRREAEVLEALARTTGGAYRPADRWGEVDTDALVRDLRRGARAVGDMGAKRGPAQAPEAEAIVRRIPAVRIAPFAALAFALLALEAARPAARRRSGSGRWRRGPPATELGPSRRRVLGLRPRHAGREGAAATTASRAGRGAPRMAGFAAGLVAASLAAGELARAGGEDAGSASPGATKATPTRAAPRAGAGAANAPSTASPASGSRAAPNAAPEAPDETPAPEALEAHLRNHPGDARALVWLGLARSRRGEGEEALRAFAAAASARDPDLAALAYYDLGVAALRAGRLETARDAFLDAVALAPDDRRALFNLEWTLEALAERGATPPPPPGSSGEPDPGADPKSGAGASERAERPDREPKREPEPEQAERRTGTETAEASERGEAPDRRGPDEPQEARRGGPGSPEPADAAGDREGSSPTGPVAAEPLSEPEARRWLEAVRDDPGRALRAAARRGEEGSAASGDERPEW